MILVTVILVLFLYFFVIPVYRIQRKRKNQYYVPEKWKNFDFTDEFISSLSKILLESL